MFTQVIYINCHIQLSYETRRLFFLMFFPPAVMSDTLTAVPECDFTDRYLVAEVV